MRPRQAAPAALAPGPGPAAGGRTARAPTPQHAAFPSASVHGGCFAHRLDSGSWGGQDRRPPLALAPRVVQPVDLGEGPLSIQGPRRPPGGGPPGPKRDEAPLPPGIEGGGLVGPSLSPWLASRKGSGSASFWTVAKFLRHVVGVTSWRGERARLSGKLSRAWARPDPERRADLPTQAGLNVDETGPQQNGPRQGTGGFRAARDTWFQSDPSRRAEVLIEVRDAELEGVLGGDSFSASRRSPRQVGGVWSARSAWRL